MAITSIAGHFCIDAFKAASPTARPSTMIVEGKPGNRGARLKPGRDNWEPKRSWRPASMEASLRAKSFPRADKTCSMYTRHT